jgi:hypothetical protein
MALNTRATHKGLRSTVTYETEVLQSAASTTSLVHVNISHKTCTKREKWHRNASLILYGKPLQQQLT